jgi:hypothetical protein
MILSQVANPDLVRVKDIQAQKAYLQPRSLELIPKEMGIDFLT